MNKDLNLFQQKENEKSNIKKQMIDSKYVDESITLG